MNRSEINRFVSKRIRSIRWDDSHIRVVAANNLRVLVDTINAARVANGQRPFGRAYERAARYAARVERETAVRGGQDLAHLDEEERLRSLVQLGYSGGGTWQSLRVGLRQRYVGIGPSGPVLEIEAVPGQVDFRRGGQY